MAKLKHENEPILKVAIPVPINRLFDFLAPEQSDTDSLLPGIRLKVPFRTGSKIGFLVEVSGITEL